MSEETTMAAPVQLALSAREMAAALSISERTLFSLTKTGSLPGVRHDRRH